jgi:hypothetical protein
MKSEKFSMSENKTVEVDQEAIAQFVTFLAPEYDDVETYAPEGIGYDDLWDGVTPRNVDRVESFGNGVHVEGSFTVRQAVDYIAASGGARGEPPINPPETIWEDREAGFYLRFTFEDEGYMEGEIEVA